MADYPFLIGKATVNSISGGITNAEVIEYAEQLPTATETSPNFIQTPDGTLYRKKAVEGSGLLGTWVFKDTLVLSGRNTFNVSFTSNSGTYTQMSYITGVANDLSYGSEVVYSETKGMGGWNNTAFKTINITDISALTNVDEFTQWLTANATGGGASVSYEYVAMQEVPTPTTADNGKVLGVTNGAYALQEASGGGGTQLYEHSVYIDVYELTCISNISTEFATISQVYSNLLSGKSFNNMGNGKMGAFICMYNDYAADKYVIVYTTDGKTLEKESYGVSYSVSDSVTPL